MTGPLASHCRRRRDLPDPIANGPAQTYTSGLAACVRVAPPNAAVARRVAIRALPVDPPASGAKRTACASAQEAPFHIHPSSPWTLPHENVAHLHSGFRLLGDDGRLSGRDVRVPAVAAH